jgi:hypothetical protein
MHNPKLKTRASRLPCEQQIHLLLIERKSILQTSDVVIAQMRSIAEQLGND